MIFVAFALIAVILVLVVLGKAVQEGDLGMFLGALGMPMAAIGGLGVLFSLYLLDRHGGIGVPVLLAAGAMVVFGIRFYRSFMNRDEAAHRAQKARNADTARQQAMQRMLHAHVGSSDAILRAKRENQAFEERQRKAAANIVEPKSVAPESPNFMERGVSRSDYAAPVNQISLHTAVLNEARAQNPAPPPLSDHELIAAIQRWSRRNPQAFSDRAMDLAMRYDRDLARGFANPAAAAHARRRVLERLDESIAQYGETLRWVADNDPAHFRDIRARHPR